MKNIYESTSKSNCWKLMKENLKRSQRYIVYSGIQIEIFPDFTSEKIQVRDIWMTSLGVLKEEKYFNLELYI